MSRQIAYGLLDTDHTIDPASVIAALHTRHAGVSSEVMTGSAGAKPAGSAVTLRCDGEVILVMTMPMPLPKQEWHLPSLRASASWPEAPSVFAGHGAHLSRRRAGGIERADQRAHAGACDAVNGDVMLFKPLQNADVRQPQRAATLKRNAHGGTASWLNRGQGRAGHVAGRIFRLLRNCGVKNQSSGKQGCGSRPAHGYTPRRRTCLQVNAFESRTVQIP